MLHVVDSTKPLERLVSDLEEAISRHKFGVLGVHDLRAKLAEKGVSFARECRIFEISTALPCRISVYEEAGKTRLATIKPTVLIGLYPNPELKGVAVEVETTLVQIMDEAAR